MLSIAVVNLFHEAANKASNWTGGSDGLTVISPNPLLGLFAFDWNFRPFANKDAVVSYQSSKDGLYDKVVMRKDLTWSDGTPSSGA